MPDAQPAAAGEYPIEVGGDSPPPQNIMDWQQSHTRAPGGDREWPTKPPRRVSDFWALMGCNAIVFVTSVCLMIIELTASRLIAGYLGSSLYTWTSVIGVVLAGISLGNYVGGRMADRPNPHRTLGWQFLVAGLTTLSVLFLNNWAAITPRPEGWDWQWWVMLVVAWVFLLPALALGTISPVVASIALKRSVKTGVTVGNIYAWGALGSIVGTFLAGFWIIGEFGTKQTIWMTSTILLLMGVLVAGGQRAFRMVVLLGVLQSTLLIGMCSSATANQMATICRKIAGIRSLWRTAPADFAGDEEALVEATAKQDSAAIETIAARRRWRRERRTAENGWYNWGWQLGTQLHSLGLTLSLRTDDPQQYHDESDYYAINVFEGNQDGDLVRHLRLDYLLHSYYNPENPTKLYYDYERVYAALTERRAALWDRETQVTLERLPTGIEFADALPAGIRLDSTTRQLSVRGAMTPEQLQRLLSLGPNGPYRAALWTTWEQADRDLKRAAMAGGGAIFTPLEELPREVEFREDVSGRIHYDGVFHALLCTGRFSFSEACDLMAQGAGADWSRAVTNLYVNSRHTSALFIGGGGYVFPRWIESRFPNNPVIDVAEIDPAVKAAVEREMGLASEFGPPQEGKTWIRTRIGDARIFVDDRLRENRKLVEAGLPPVTYDFVYGDAFNDLSVPWHLTTAEFSAKVREVLTPNEGVYLVNIIDIFPRAEYPEPGTKVGVGVARFPGPLPTAILPEQLPPGDFVAARGGFPELEIAVQDQEFLLRFNGVMTTARRDALLRLDAGTNRQFASAIKELFESTRATKSLDGTPPPQLFPVGTPLGVWTAAQGAVRELEIFVHPDETFSYGFRGVMDPATRDKLLAEAPNDPEFAAAIRSLESQSQNHKTGQFLGRYVETVSQVFRYVYVFTSNEGEPGDDRDTFVVACSDKKLTFENLEASGGYWRQGPFASTAPHEDGPTPNNAMPAILSLARGIRLTDDFAPVDNLLAPVFISRSNDTD
ncbi:MAG: fused MFS/spermidine synthase [Planctomycetales bacterium]